MGKPKSYMTLEVCLLTLGDHGWDDPGRNASTPCADLHLEEPQLAII